MTDNLCQYCLPHQKGRKRGFDEYENVFIFEAKYRCYREPLRLGAHILINTDGLSCINYLFRSLTDVG